MDGVPLQERRDDGLKPVLLAVTLRQDDQPFDRARLFVPAWAVEPQLAVLLSSFEGFVELGLEGNEEGFGCWPFPAPDWRNRLGATTSGLSAPLS